jgi:hypothetical protein
LKVILHIGTEKTGTSSIQHFLHVNRRRLSKSGFHLMRSAGDYDQRALAAYTRSNDEADYYFFEQGIKSNSDKEKFRTDLEAVIDKELSSLPKRIHSVIISSEHFHSTLRNDQAIDKLRKLLSKYFKKVQIICYLREQGALCTSSYSTALKSGICRTLENFARLNCSPKNYYYNYWQLLSKWETAFGQEALDIAIYDKLIFRNGDLLQDFTSRVDPLLQGNLKPYKRKENQSLSPDGQRLLLGVNCAFPRKQHDFNTIRIQCREEIYELLKGQGQQLNLQTKRSIYYSFLESNTAVRKKYFPDRIALFPEPNEVVRNDEGFSYNGKRALARVLKAISLNKNSLLSIGQAEDASYLIQQMYLYKASIPFSWDHVHLFSKGILPVNHGGEIHALIAIQNESDELLEFSRSSNCLYSIGWQILDRSGAPIATLFGTIDVEKNIPAASFKLVSLSFCVDYSRIEAENAGSIEFCIVDNEKWMNQKHPLNSAWSMLVLV